MQQDTSCSSGRHASSPTASARVKAASVRVWDKAAGVRTCNKTPVRVTNTG